MTYNIALTKTAFKHYLDCPESSWLFQNRPEEYPKAEFSLFLEKLIVEGYEVEEYAKSLFSNGITIPENASPEVTTAVINGGGNVFFQPSFTTKKDVFARVDVLERLADNTWHIYEVKSSTSVKKDRGHSHLEDACFQKYVLEESGLKVSKISIIHLDKGYIKRGSIRAREMLKAVDLTEQVEANYTNVLNKINAARHFLAKNSTSLDQCSCRLKTRRNHCDSFKLFNRNLPKYSIYEIGRISAKKINGLLQNNCISISTIPVDFELNTKQQLQVKSLRQQKAIINKNSIRNVISPLKYPLHFVDYETYASAVPKVDGLSPHKHLVFQVSIHTLKKNGELAHFEWLGNKMELPFEMLEQMQEFSGTTGTYISWHASFERGRNKDMIEWIPRYASYLKYINNNMFDLEKVFMEDYVDYRFRGKSSIKKVLPVLCPKFSYSNLKIQEGTMALDTWGRMVSDPSFDEDLQQTRGNLLAYCKLDTLAMVEIYKIIAKVSL